MNRRLRCILCASLPILLSLLSFSARAQNQATTVNVDANANRHAINPFVYGLAYAGAANLAALNVLLNRQGGNNTSRYNWQINADNRDFDWYFESIGDASATAGERGDTFISNSKSAGAQAMLTIPMVGWVAKLGPNRSKLSSFSVAKYGAQTATDPYYSDAGNGVSQSTGQYITGNDPNDANVPADSTYQLAWMQHLTSQWGTAANGGLNFYLMDNEPSIWFSTHRDVHPTGPTMDEIYNKIVDYAGKVKGNDPSALVAGPEEWGWSGYFYSGYDQQYGSQHGWSNLPDRANHGGWDYLPWLLNALHQNDVSTGQRLLDVFSVHYYPQSGEFSNDVSTAMQLLRNQSTRSLWDPNYVDQSWIGAVVQLIPRIKNWVATYYPNTQTAITEYNWGAEGHINGATTQADILGIFGREGLDMATRWTTPDPSTPTYNAIKMYRNYDGAKSTFGDTSVSATVANPDNLSAFASVRASDGALTVMVINKVLSGSTPVTINLANFAAGSTAQAWQLTASNAITQLSNVTVSGAAITTTVPPQSITLFVVPSVTAPTFTGTASASPATVAAGVYTKITAKVTCTSNSLTNGIVDLEVYNPSGIRVSRKYWVSQNLTSGQSKTYSWSWRAPVIPGNYTVKVGVYSAGWVSNLYWNNAAATVTVTSSDTAQYNFEGSTQGWASSGGMITGVTASKTQHFAGFYSLAVKFASPAAGDTQMAYVANPTTPAGSTVTFHVWVPAASKITAIQPYVQQGAGGGWTWTGNWQPISSLQANAWNTITVTVPSNAVTPLYQLGVQFFTNGAWSGTCYVDSVGW